MEEAVLVRFELLLLVMAIYKFQLDSPLPPTTACQRIRDQVQFVAPPQYGMRQGMFAALPFAGTVKDRSFKIQRIITGRNSFLPVIKGKLTENGVGTRLNVVMHIRPVVFAFVTFWLLGTVFIALVVGLEATLAAVAMFIFGVCLVLMGFVPEAILAKRLIVKSLTS